mmetsp:Transcript_52508/g.139818  ORF Transcript_52508/g.139818 Transcript_52508/m.139818 type:complete len:201 (-) Transcript_52508:126-728(-)
MPLLHGVDILGPQGGECSSEGLHAPKSGRVCLRALTKSPSSFDHQVQDFLRFDLHKSVNSKFWNLRLDCWATSPHVGRENRNNCGWDAPKTWHIIADAPIRQRVSADIEGGGGSPDLNGLAKGGEILIGQGRLLLTEEEAEVLGASECRRTARKPGKKNGKIYVFGFDTRSFEHTGNLVLRQTHLQQHSGHRRTRHFPTA